MTTTLSSGAALWFLVPMVPLCLFVIWDDLANLKIRNLTVLATFAAFLIAGFVVFPWQTVLFQSALGLATLAVTFTLFILRVMGGGDAKYIAAIVPFFNWNDWTLILVLFCAITIITLLLHRLLRATIGPKIFPSWKSWTSGKRFPLGLPLAVIVLTYLGLSL